MLPDSWSSVTISGEWGVNLSRITTLVSWHVAALVRPSTAAAGFLESPLQTAQPSHSYCLPGTQARVPLVRVCRDRIARCVHLQLDQTLPVALQNYSVCSSTIGHVQRRVL